ncbi:MAG: flavodoxin family protein [Candidatus Bathyarchaeota archaeon]|nr:flavodoxin family protein [Candidatus Bathyarchaeota archaeon]
MKVLGLVGSPRKGGNTDLLVDAVLFGAGAAGGVVEKLYLYDAKIMPCVDCRACKTGGFKCVLGDSMQQLYGKLEDADVLVFGTPLYWYGPTAQMKLFLDRLRPYIASGKLEGKKAVLIVPSQEGADACRSTVGMFEASFKYLGVDLVGKLLPTAYEKAEIKKQPDTLTQAFELGKTL